MLLDVSYGTTLTVSHSSQTKINLKILNKRLPIQPKFNFKNNKKKKNPPRSQIAGTPVYHPRIDHSFFTMQKQHAQGFAWADANQPACGSFFANWPRCKDQLRSSSARSAPYVYSLLKAEPRSSPRASLLNAEG